MKRITIWDYSCNTREDYLSLSNHEKEVLLKKILSGYENQDVW